MRRLNAKGVFGAGWEIVLKTYVITGGAGFIGSHLADALLAAGHAVRVVDDFSTGKHENLDPRCTVLEGDVRDAALLSRAMEGAAGCFHLAAIASVERTNRDWIGTHGINQGGTVAVLDAARAAGADLLDLGTERELVGPLLRFAAARRGRRA